MAALQITHADASAAILSACEAGRLVQGAWHERGPDGREIACLLGAIHPSVKSPADCNGDLMPMWLAELTPVLFDGLPADAVTPVAWRFGALVARWHALSPGGWDAVLRDFLIRVIDDAVDAARPVCKGQPYWQQVSDACARSRAAIQSDDGAGAAEAAAWAARAAWAAARAAEAAAWAAGASGAAEAAARAAEAAAWAAEASRAHYKLFTFLLDRIEFHLDAEAA